MAKLAAVASSPGEHHALVVDCSRVIVAERKFCNRVLLEVFQLPRNWLSPHIHISKSTKLSVSPSVDDAVFGYYPGIVVASGKEFGYLSILMLLEWIRVQLMWTFNIL